MKIDLSSILKEVGSKQHIEISEAMDFHDEPLELTKPVNVNADITNTGKSILLKGVVSTEIKLDCGRCLNKYNFPLHFRIEEQYCKNSKDYKDITGEIELTDEDFVYLIEEDNTIDLYEIIRQNIIAQIPIKPLCSLDCIGIQVITDTKEEIDPRFAKLKEFKERHLKDKNNEWRNN